MRGLLLKDGYTLTKQLKIFLFLLVIFSLMPGYSVSTFGVMYAALLPITALGYDERSRWDALAATMPYSVKSLVLSRYVLGFLCVGAFMLLALCAQAVMHATGANTAQRLTALAAVACASLLVLAFSLPFLFRFGAEKGRLVLFALVALLALFTTVLDGKLLAPLSPLASSLALLLLAILANAVSVPLSIAMYKRRWR